MFNLSLRRLVTVCAVLVMTGCASPSSSVLLGEARAPIESTAVKLYLEAPEAYEKIALIEATSDSSWSFGEQAKMDAVVQRLKEAAAELGANGILLQSTGEQQGSSVHLGTGTGGYSGNVGFGISLGRTFGLTDKTAQAMAIYVPTNDNE